MKTNLNFSNNVKSKFLLLFIATSTILILSSCSKDNDNINSLTTEKYVKFDNAMHKLWADHMQWTYATVDSYFNNKNALQAQLNRLLKNQEDIGAAIIPYYGQSVGDRLTVLLKEHINGAVPVLEAAKNNDQVALEKAVTKWRANAKEIADFLTSANPDYWVQTHMREYMDLHITQTITYSVDLLKQNYTQAVINYDLALEHMMHQATYLSEGIAKQHPTKFY